MGPKMQVWGRSKLSILDKYPYHTSPALPTAITPGGDVTCSERVTMHCHWGRKPPQLPLPIGISSPCRRRTEPRP